MNSQIGTISIVTKYLRPMKQLVSYYVVTYFNWNFGTVITLSGNPIRQGYNIETVLFIIGQKHKNKNKNL